MAFTAEQSRELAIGWASVPLGRPIPATNDRILTLLVAEFLHPGSLGPERTGELMAWLAEREADRGTS